MAGPPELLVVLLGAARANRRLIGQLGRLVGQAERVDVMLSAAVKVVRADPARLDSPTTRAILAQVRQTRRTRRQLERAAQLGLESLKWQMQADGTAVFETPAARPFALTRRLAALLAILAKQPRLAGDTFPQWIQIHVLVDSLSKIVDAPITRRGVVQLLYRLRRRLEDAGLSPFLIESSRVTGIRLRLGRPSSR